MCHRVFFIENTNKKCILSKKADIGLKHVVYECEELKRERKLVLKEYK